MGRITIVVAGSFPRTGTVEVGAQDGGHALAIQKAIEHLNGLLPGCIQRDHELQSQGSEPSFGFGKDRSSTKKG
ncbi:hypothetical protein KAR91_02515 [Candidatus Pacearchaeota archaeon]|nr:hypothetical protein [Candidatus Pacearchaeota archaeon]